MGGAKRLPRRKEERILCMKRTALIALIMVLVLGLLIGCTPKPETPPTDGSDPVKTDGPVVTDPTPVELEKVRIGALPYFDYTLLIAAKGVGLDREMGLDFEIIPFPLENVAVQALINGSIDIAQGAIASFYPVWPNAPELRVFLNNDQTMGFTIVARADSGIKTFAEFYEELDGDYEAARTAALAQMKGKSMATLESVYLGTINSALAAGGLVAGDLEIMNFANDGQANAAFQSGECDLYMGGMNNTLLLLEQSDKYVSLAMGDQMGIGGFWLSGSGTTEKYLEEKRDTVMKVLAVHYRAAELLKKEPENFVPYQLEYLKEHASSDLTLEQGIWAMQEMVDFQTLDQSLATIYNTESPIYWKHYADYYLDQNYSSGAIPEGSIDLAKVVVQESLFFEFLQHEDLVDYVRNGLK